MSRFLLHFLFPSHLLFLLLPSANPISHPNPLLSPIAAPYTAQRAKYISSVQPFNCFASHRVSAPQFQRLVTESANWIRPIQLNRRSTLRCSQLTNTSSPPISLLDLDISFISPSSPQIPARSHLGSCWIDSCRIQ
jgi:hypothetical protein